MRVLYVINEICEAGAEKLLVESMHFYQKKIQKADVLVLRETGSLLEQELKSEIIGEFIVLGATNIYNPFLVFKLIRFFKKYDIIHVHLFPVLYWTALAKWLSKTNAVLIYTEHNTTNRRRRKFLFRFVDKFIYSMYSKIVAISFKAESNLREYLKPNNSKILTINNGINLSVFTDASVANLSQDENIKIFMVARFHYPKDQKTLIESLLHLDSNVHLYFVGNGNSLTECKLLSENLKLKGRVHFLGIRSDVPNLLKAADIVVMSSGYEGLSLSSIEGMACGKPFIASDVDGLREVVSGAGILFKFGDSANLALNIQSLLDDKNYYNLVAERCMERAKLYDISKMVDSYMSVYSEVIYSSMPNKK